MKRLLQEKFLLYKVRSKKDPDAFGKIYDAYAPRIYRFVFFKVSSEEEAKDITADVFLKAWQYLLDEKGKEVQHLGGLLYRIARNRVIDFYRSRAANETVPLINEAEQVSDASDLQKEVDIKMSAETAGQYLRLLKDEYREVLVMKYLDEMETSEIAEALDKTPGNVRVLLHRAMNALRNVMHNPDHEKGIDLTIEEAPNAARGRKS